MRRKEALMSLSMETPTKPCQHLRTKNRYCTVPNNAESWLPGVDTSSAYWCLLTMGPAGPDDHYAHLSRCTPSRACYEKIEE
jgi:hypothetical protein